MEWLKTSYFMFLFFILSPGVLLRLPSKGGKYTVAAIHSILFAFLSYVSYQILWTTHTVEGASDPTECQMNFIRENADKYWFNHKRVLTEQKDKDYMDKCMGWK